MPRSPDRLLLLEVFLRVLERDSVSRAAQDLGMSLGRASGMLRALEDRLGTPLLARTTHPVLVTRAGADFARHARTLVDSRQGPGDAHADGRGGRARLSIVMTTELGPDALFELLTRRVEPEAMSTLRLTEHDAGIAFHRAGCDLWVRVGDVPDDTLVAETVGRVDTVLVAAPDHESIGGVREPADLAGVHAVGRPHSPDAGWRLSPARRSERGPTDAPDAPDADAVDASTHAATPSFRVLTDHPRRTHRAALQGLGLAALPLPWVHDDLEAGTLVRVLPDWIADRRPVHIVHAPERDDLASLHAWVDALRRGIPDIAGVDAP